MAHYKPSKPQAGAAAAAPFFLGAASVPKLTTKTNKLRLMSNLYTYKYTYYIDVKTIIYTKWVRDYHLL